MAQGQHHPRQRGESHLDPQNDIAPVTLTTDPSPSSHPPSRLPASALRNVRFRPLDRQQSVIQLRRLRDPLPPRSGPEHAASSTQNPPRRFRSDAASRDAATPHPSRPGSGPEIEPQHPQREHLVALPQGDGTLAIMKPLPPVPEADADTVPRTAPVDDTIPAGAQQVELPADPRRGRVRRLLGWRRQPGTGQALKPVSAEDCYDSRIVDFLDVIDPEVATLSSITNVQNSLFVPSLGRWVNRRPTYDLSQLPKMPGAYPPSKEEVSTEGETHETQQSRPSFPRVHSLSSVLTDTQYAVLPEDATLEGWREEDIKLLNGYVRHMLHSRRSKFKQRMKAFGQYTRRPLGFFVTLYATLITLFGLAWVLFLIGWIYVGEKQLYVINVIDYVLVALFAVVGDGLGPFRAIDTYHMFFVAHYHRKTWKLRSNLLLPGLKDHNDLPTADASAADDSADIEAARSRQPGDGSEQEDDLFFPVLSEKEQETLLHHQEQLAKSHTFYKPHETETHFAFPLRLLIAVVLLLDLHSCLQISLGVCTWGIEYAKRPAALTTTILCCSIATNALAGVLISVGDRRTRKKDVLERLLKQDLTAEVMGKMQKQKQKEEEREAKGDDSKEDNGLLGLGLPLVEKMRKSSDRGSESSSRKDKDQAGRFDTGQLGAKKRSEVE